MGNQRISRSNVLPTIRIVVFWQHHEETLWFLIWVSHSLSKSWAFIICHRKSKKLCLFSRVSYGKSWLLKTEGLTGSPTLTSMGSRIKITNGIGQTSTTINDTQSSIATSRAPTCLPPFDPGELALHVKWDNDTLVGRCLQVSAVFARLNQHVNITQTTLMFYALLHARGFTCKAGCDYECYCGSYGS